MRKFEKELPVQIVAVASRVPIALQELNSLQEYGDVHHRVQGRVFKVGLIVVVTNLNAGRRRTEVDSDSEVSEGANGVVPLVFGEVPGRIQHDDYIDVRYICATTRILVSGSWSRGALREGASEGWDCSGEGL